MPSQTVANKIAIQSQSRVIYGQNELGTRSVACGSESPLWGRAVHVNSTYLKVQ